MTTSFPSWMTPAVASRLTRLGKSRRFKDCLAKITNPRGGKEEEEQWRQLWFQHDPDMTQIEYLKHLKPFDQMVFLCHFRPDKIPSALRYFVSSTLGSDFLDASSPLDLGRAFSESVAATPIILVLGRSVDPLKYVLRYAEEAGFVGSRLKMVTLGVGQEDRAKELIKDLCTV